MKNINLYLICMLLSIGHYINAQNCITDSDLDTNIDNSSGTFVIPAGTLTDVASIHFGFSHTFIQDINLQISDGVTTVVLYDGAADGSEDAWVDQQNFADTGVAYNSTSQDLSQEEVLQPFSGTLASLDASMTLTVTVADGATGDPVTWSSSDGIMVLASDGESVHFIPTTASCPSNDEICNATPLTFDIGTNSGSQNAGDNSYATTSANEPAGTNFNGEPGSTFNDCGGTSQDNPPNPGYSTWHSITPDVTGQHCFAEGTAAFGVDFQMALYSGTPCPSNDYSALSLLATSDDDGVGGTGPLGTAYASNTIGAPANTGGDAAFCVDLTAGQTYYLQMSTVSLYSQTSPGGGCPVSFSSWTDGSSYSITVTEPDVPNCEASTTMSFN